MSEPLREAIGLRLTVSRARSAARAGALDEALRLLDALGAAAAADVTVLDLRARVHAQRGEFAEADRCWAAVQDTVPDDPAAAEGRRAVARIVASRPGRPAVRTGRVAVVAAATAVAVLAGGAAWLGSGGADAPRPAAVGGPGAAGTGDQARRADALERRLKALETAATAAAKAAADKAHDLDTVTRALAMPGLRVTRRSDEVRVLFETGVFLHDTVVSSRAATLLATVGERLARLDVPVTTTVVGHTVVVPGGLPGGGSPMALARARVAVDHLAAGGGLPLTSFTLASGDQRRRLFPDDPRNRTVSLHIALKEAPKPG